MTIPTHEYKITETELDILLNLFNDRNPIHFDKQEAEAKGFKEPIMHGAILNCFLSHFIGMIYPGPGSIVLSAEMKFFKPCFLNDIISINATLNHYNESNNIYEILVNFINKTQNYKCALGKVLVKN